MAAEPGAGRRNRSLLRIVAPGLVLALTAAHPGYSTDASAEVGRITASGIWLPLHLALLPAFALYGTSMLAWPTGGGAWWRLRQGGVALSVVFYSAFIGVDGVAGWLLAHAAAQAPAGLRPGLADGLTTLFSAGPVAALALAGSAGWLIAAVAVAAESADHARLLLPAGLLVLSAVVLGISHAPPAGPAGAGLALAGASLLDLPSARRSRQAADGTGDGAGQSRAPSGDSIDR